jgi:hypothetical protein
MPVNSLTIPARALAWRPLRSRLSQTTRDVAVPEAGKTPHQIGQGSAQGGCGAFPLTFSCRHKAYLMNPKLSSLIRIRCAARSGVSSAVSIRISGSSGASYGSEIPVNSLMIPARAFA